MPVSAVSGKAGAIRVLRLGGVALAAAEAHALRQDKNGRARSKFSAPPVTTTGLLIGNLYTRHVEGCLVQKSHTKALHLIVQFPKDLVDGEDAAHMLKHARSFAEQVFGSEAIFHDRVDRDEQSRHVVDLMVAPRYVKVTKKKSQRAITTSKHLKELAKSQGMPDNLRGQGRALQTAWFEYMRDVMQLEGVERGARKTRPGDDWKSPEQLAADADREEAAKELEAARRKHEEAREILDAPRPELPTITPPTFSERLAPDRWIAEQNSRLAEAAGQASARIAASDHERRRLAAELEQARRLTAGAERIAAERDAARRREEAARRALEIEKTTSARLAKQRDAAARQVKELVEAEPLDLAVEVAPKLGLVPDGPVHLTDDGRRLVLDAESWEEPAESAHGIGAISLVMHVLRARFEEAIRWLAERFGVLRVQADLAATVEISEDPAPILGGPAGPGL